MVVYNPGNDDPVVPPEEDRDPPVDGAGQDPDSLDGGDETDGSADGADSKQGGKRKKYRVGDVVVMVVAERVQYYGKDGKLITESLKDYTKKAVTKEFTSLNAFLTRWNAADQKQAIVQASSDGAFHAVHVRNERKATTMKKSQIHAAWRTLKQQGWLPSDRSS